jgi:hypothetical protein
LVVGKELFPRPPCAPWQRKISHPPEQTDPNVGGLTQSTPFVQPSISNQAMLATMSETFRIGVTALASMAVFLRIGGCLRPRACETLIGRSGAIAAPTIAAQILARQSDDVESEWSEVASVDQTEARYATGPRIVPSLHVFHVHSQPLGPE